MRKASTTEDLADRLHSAAIHLLRLVRVQDAATGVAPARLSALSVIVFGGPVSLNDLARAEQVRPPTMSRIVDALEAEGLARRTVHKSRLGRKVTVLRRGLARAIERDHFESAGRARAEKAIRLAQKRKEA